MGYSNEVGYTPATVEALMSSVMENVNTQFGTTYTAETFLGTNFYKYFYSLIQRLQENEVKTSEIFLKLQDYFDITNESISRPVVTNPGLIEILGESGYLASVKKPIDADAGKVYICVNVDDTDPDYADTKLAIGTIIKNSTVAGVVTQGTEVETIVLDNGQSFDFKYNLPNITEPLLRLTITLSDNNTFVVKTPDEIKADLMANIAAKYSLGKNFEPQKYYTIIDAPWAESVLLEYSTNAGASWASTVVTQAYDDLWSILLANITVIEA